MSMRNPAIRAAGAFAILVASAACATASAQTQADLKLGLGTPLGAQDLAGYFAIRPDGQGLPPGKGTVAQGRIVFQENCAACHGERLEGNLTPGLGGDRLIGGRGSLTSQTPVKTVESYWPYATTLFDYVKRAMPFNAPGSLTDDQVYAVAAYILNQANILGPDAVMDAKSLPAVGMPNREAFIPDRRPEVELYR
jgi:cytochrome c